MGTGAYNLKNRYSNNRRSFVKKAQLKQRCTSGFNNAGKGFYYSRVVSTSDKQVGMAWSPRVLLDQTNVDIYTYSDCSPSSSAWEHRALIGGCYSTYEGFFLQRSALSRMVTWYNALSARHTYTKPISQHAVHKNTSLLHRFPRQSMQRLISLQH